MRISELLLCIALNPMFVYGLGISIFDERNKKPQYAWILGLFLLIFSVFGSTAAFLAEPFFASNESKWVRPLGYLLADLALSGLLWLICMIFRGETRNLLVSHLSQAAFSYAMFGVCFVSAEQAGNLKAAFLLGLRCGIGLWIAAAMICTAGKHLCAAPVPRCVRGWPAVLLYTGILAMTAACLQ